MGAFLFLVSGITNAETIRATELTADVMEKLQSNCDIVVEFRLGDRLPVQLKAEGDLLETEDVTPTYVVIKKNFFIKPSENTLLLSFDNSVYKPFNELITGSLTAGASSNKNGGPANVVDIFLKVFLK